MEEKRGKDANTVSCRKISKWKERKERRMEGKKEEKRLEIKQKVKEREEERVERREVERKGEKCRKCLEIKLTEVRLYTLKTIKHCLKCLNNQNQ